MGSKPVEDRVAADFYGGLRGGVNGTPTFSINGLRYDGERSYRAMLRTSMALRTAPSMR
jgi:protein-disulfide isomerase